MTPVRTHKITVDDHTPSHLTAEQVKDSSCVLDIYDCDYRGEAWMEIELTEEYLANKSSKPRIQRRKICVFLDADRRDELLSFLKK